VSAELDPERDLAPPYGTRDPGGMAGLVERAPEQIEAALALCDQRAWPAPSSAPDLLAVGGMGGSAIAADLCAGLWSDRLERPLVAVREYRWPAYVSENSLVLLSSYSGDTEETLSLYEEAGRRGIPRVALTTGGHLAERCRRDGVFCLVLPGGISPRAALYQSWVAVSRLLAALGWIDDPGAHWRAAAIRLRERNARIGPRTAEADNPAKRLARGLHGRFVFVYAGSERLGAVATRVRNQLNENAKLLGHSATAPELCHNEIVGWEGKGAHGSRAAVLILRDREDSPRVAERLAWTAEYAARRGVPMFEISETEGERLSRMVSMVQTGDYVSVYLALLAGVDPTPIESIDELKRRLSEREPTHG
jgi:glucose/mannose-6-phosphate isomerase